MPDCSPDGMRSARMPHVAMASAVFSPTAAIFRPENARASSPYSSNFSRTALTALTLVNATHS